MMGIDRKKGLELPLIPGQIGQRVQKNAQAVLEEHPDEMERVYRLIQFIFDTRLKEGLLGLEDAARKFADPCLCLRQYLFPHPDLPHSLPSIRKGSCIVAQ